MMRMFVIECSTEHAKASARTDAKYSRRGPVASSTAWGSMCVATRPRSSITSDTNTRNLKGAALVMHMWPETTSHCTPFEQGCLHVLACHREQILCELCDLVHFHSGAHGPQECAHHVHNNHRNIWHRGQAGFELQSLHNTRLSPALEPCKTRTCASAAGRGCQL
jgi:hypothetical protein